MELLKPPALKEGDTVMIIAPSNSMSVFAAPLRERATKLLNEFGLNVRISTQADRVYGHTAGTPRERANAIMEAFTNSQVQAVMAVYGGFSTNDTIEHLDYDIIRKNPKVFIGYSDITILNTVLHERAGLVNFHGPGLVTFAHPTRMQYELDIFRDVLMRGTAPYTVRESPTLIDDHLWYTRAEPPAQEKNSGWEVIKQGVAQGRLIGGNLGTLLALAGTKHWPDLSNKILFVEDEEHEKTGSVGRYFRQLRQMGVYDKIKGMMIGRFPRVVGFNANDSVRMIVEDCTEGYDFPIVSEMDFGHTRPLITIPVGIDARIDTNEKTITYLEPAVR